MKILFLKPLLGEGGGVRWVLDLSRWLTKKGHQVTLVYFKERGVDPRRMQHLAERAGVDLVHVKGVKPPKGMPLTFHLSKVVEWINSSDVWYCFNEPPNSLIFASMKKTLRAIKKPAILGIHTTFTRIAGFSKLYVHALRKYIVHGFEGVHVLNLSMKKFIGGLASPSKVFMIPNGVDVEKFKAAYARRRSRFTILWTGRLYRDKGIDVLSEVIEALKEEGCKGEVQFTITGAGPLESVVERLSAKYDFVKYLGYVSERELMEVYSNADLYLLTSRVEGMPLRLLEASAAGLPTVASKIPGVIEVLDTIGTGSMVDLRLGSRGFVEEVKRYYSMWREDPEGYEKLMKKTRERTLKFFDWRELAEQFEERLLAITA